FGLYNISNVLLRTKNLVLNQKASFTNKPSQRPLSLRIFKSNSIDLDISISPIISINRKYESCYYHHNSHCYSCCSSTVNDDALVRRCGSGKREELTRAVQAAVNSVKGKRTLAEVDVDEISQALYGGWCTP
ncbi:hypothetical protein BKA64DRAFT_750745, partial [Cadophora sp. MPI-SDFR-AT-0126]